MVKIMNEDWVLMNKQADFARLSKKFGVSPLLIKLMINREINEDEMQDYLKGSIELLCDPSAMKDIDLAADIIEKTVNTSESIAIVTDYDCDGIFSGMVLYTGLRRIGARPVLYTPDRIAEGYGINKRIIDEIYNSGINYVITCDNGIAAIDEITYAKKLGMTVIITDHHEIPFEEINGERNYSIPPADVICNPKQLDCSYPFKGLCGAGVAYRLIELLYKRNGVADSEKKLLIAYTAIATVADIMELQGENRVIVKEGLKQFANTDNIGLNAIKEANGLNGKLLSTYSIGFVIGPCFNAAGRLGTVKLAFDLLQSDDKEKAAKLAGELKALNDERKAMTDEGAKKGNELANGEELRSDKVLVVLLEGCHESLAGIIAGRIKDNFYKPTIVFTNTGDGRCKGSGRSIPPYHMFDELTRCKDLFERFGGHAMAAGITMQLSNISELRRRLNENTTLTDKEMTPVIKIDAELLVRHITEDMVKSVSILEPFGNGNKKPVFCGRHFGVNRAWLIGKNKNVLKMLIKDVEGNVINAVCFQNTDKLLALVEKEYGKDQTDRMLRGVANNVDLAFTFYPEINEYNGLRNMQLIVQNFCVIRR